jgi:recombination protein RecA
MTAQSENGEDDLNITEALIRSGALGVVVVDSVAALMSKAELDGQIGAITIRFRARMTSHATRRLTSTISKITCVCIFTKQIREKIGAMCGNPETTPGGRALKIFAPVRLDIQRTAQIKNSGRVTGNRSRVKIVKNKVVAPFTEGEFDIMFDERISKTGSIINLGLEHKIVEKKQCGLPMVESSSAKIVKLLNNISGIIQKLKMFGRRNQENCPRFRRNSTRRKCR